VPPFFKIIYLIGLHYYFIKIFKIYKIIYLNIIFVSRIVYRVSREEKERKKIGKTKEIAILFFIKVTH